MKRYILLIILETINFSSVLKLLSAFGQILIYFDPCTILSVWLSYLLISKWQIRCKYSVDADAFHICWNTALFISGPVVLWTQICLIVETSFYSFQRCLNIYIFFQKCNKILKSIPKDCKKYDFKRHLSEWSVWNLNIFFFFFLIGLEAKKGDKL